MLSLFIKKKKQFWDFPGGPVGLRAPSAGAQVQSLVREVDPQATTKKVSFCVP